MHLGDKALLDAANLVASETPRLMRLGISTQTLGTWLFGTATST